MCMDVFESEPKMKRNELVSCNTITTSRRSRQGLAGVFRKEIVYSAASSGGLLLFAVMKFIRLIKSDWLFDTNYEWYRNYAIHIIVLFTLSALCILLASNSKWSNILLVAFISFFEYDVIFDYDIEWYGFRITLLKITILLLMLSERIFWTRLSIIASRLIWISLWGAYIIAFLHLLQNYNHNIAYLYMGLVSLLLITLTQTLETFEVLTVITSKLSLLPPSQILLCVIHTEFSHPSDSLIVGLVDWFPVFLLSISCYCFCRLQLLNRAKKQTLSVKTGMCKILSITPFILLGIVYGNRLL